MTTIGWIVSIAAFVVAAVIFFLLGIRYRKNVAEREISSAEEEATRIINEAIKSSENKKREALLEAKEEILKSRSEYEREVKERRADLQKQERRLQQKEENLDHKMDSIEKKEEALTAKHAAADKAAEEIKNIKHSQMEMLERISGFTADEAKDYLIAQVESDVTHETAIKIKEIEARAKEEADQRAREIVATAIQRCAADHVAEITVSVVPLPNDEMKGRIIGREGRNIRTLETLTGADLIIDDTPEAITVSCFEPVRREVARLALEKLIADGRIHPTHIEEMVEKARREVDAVIRSEGERAVLETGVRGIHPELQKLLGRLRYRTSYGQNVLQHSIEVSHIAGMMAAELGADVQTAKRAGLLHDVTKALPGPEQLKLCDKYGMMLDTFERSHPKLLHAKSGAAVAGAVFGESAAVQSAICWHTTGKPDMTLLQKILYLADYMEPNRDFPGVERLRALAEHDLDEAVLLGLEMSLDLLTETGQPIDVNSRAARDFLKSERTKSE